MSKKSAVIWTPQQLADYEKRRGVVYVQPAPMAEAIKKKRRRVMNRTEGRFADVLEAMKKREEIANYSFEGMTLRWGNDEAFSYTPDFTVIHSTNWTDRHRFALRFIEVKGAHIRNADWSRFKHARDNHPLFDFELWQFKQSNWTRLA